MKIVDVVFVYHLVEHQRVAWHGRYHSHNCGEYELHFFLDGAGALLCGKKRFLIAPQKFFIAAPGEFHSIIPDFKARPITYYAILFYCTEHDREMLRLLNEVFEQDARELSVSSAHRLQCEDIMQLFKSGDGVFAKSAEHLLTSLLFRIYREYGLSCIDSCTLSARPLETKKNSGYAHVSRALYIMQKNDRKNLTVDEIARILALSTGHFIRIFRAETKLTPYQYILRLKIEGASGLLISTTKTIGEIADWFGFENQFHFSRCFKKCTGVSPNEYRRIYLQTADFTAL